MTLVNVELGDRAYPVRIESGGLDWAGQMLAPYARDGRIVVVTDRNVLAAQGDRLTAGLNRAGLEPDGIVIAPGEESKDWSHLARLIDDLTARGVGRGRREPPECRGPRRRPSSSISGHAVRAGALRTSAWPQG